MEAIRKSFISIGFAGSYTLGLIDNRHILIKFQMEDDYVRAFLKRIYSIDGFIMRLFKWSPQFSVESESAILPIWINLPLLPLHLFHKEALYNIARLIGEPLKMDASTTALSRPSVARVCVELDLRKSRPEKIWIVNGDSGFWQPVEYEKIPPLCSKCRKIGHQSDACRSVDSRPAPRAVADTLKETLLPIVRPEYRPKLASVSILPNGNLANDPGQLSNEAAVEQSAADFGPKADAAAEALNLCNSNSGETLPAPLPTLNDANAISTSVGVSNSYDCLPVSTFFSKNMDFLPPDLLAVSLANDASPPLAKNFQLEIDDIHRLDIFAHESVQMSVNPVCVGTGLLGSNSRDEAPVCGQKLQSPAVDFPFVDKISPVEPSCRHKSPSCPDSLTPQTTPSVVVSQTTSKKISSLESLNAVSVPSPSLQDDVFANFTAYPVLPFDHGTFHSDDENQAQRNKKEQLLMYSITPKSQQPSHIANEQTPPKFQEASSSTCGVSHPTSDIVLAHEVVDIAPLAVLHRDGASCFEEYNEDLIDYENEFPHPIVLPNSVRGKKKKSNARSDRVLRQKRNTKS